MCPVKRSDLDELFEHYPQLIALMPGRFTSHEFILKLAQRNQKAYIEALYAYRLRIQPFRKLHTRLAKQLNEHRDLVRKAGRDTTSPDIFTAHPGCMTWSKVGK